MVVPLQKIMIFDYDLIDYFEYFNRFFIFFPDTQNRAIFTPSDI